MCGVATREHHCLCQFGTAGQECGWITSRQIEASRRAMTRYVKRRGQDLGSGSSPDKPVSHAPLPKTRYGAPVRATRILGGRDQTRSHLFEIGGT